MELTIRPASVDDHLSVHEILMSPHVLRGTMRVPQSPVEQTRERLTPARGVIQLVAEDAGEIVGFAELITHPDDPRERHAGEINLVAVRESWLGKGVGKALCAELVDLADNWLNSPASGWSCSRVTSGPSASTSASASPTRARCGGSASETAPGWTPT